MSFKASKQMWRTAGRYSSLGIEMTASVVIGMLLGNWADNHFHSQPWGMMLGFLAGLGAATKAVFTALKTLQAPPSNNTRTGPNDRL
jgi:F0F1-type ATP synthase assembly protein I